MAGLVTLALIVGSCRGAPPKTQQLNVLVASYDLAIGDDQRFMVGLVTTDQKLVTSDSADLAFAFSGDEFGPQKKAPFLPLPGATAGEAQDHVTGVYATRVGFDRAGFWQVRARVEGGLEGNADFEVHEKHQVPAPGDPAPRSQNHTIASQVPRAAIDSRAAGGVEIPDPQLHQVTIADAIARGRPALVVFSTPEFCVSRFCGPVTDLVAELASTYAAKAEFIHIEIWEDQAARKFNPTAEEWLLRGDLQEPWVFLIGSDGRIAARWDNIATKAEIEPLLMSL